MSKNFRQLFVFFLILALISCSIPGGKAYALENSAEQGLTAWYKLDAPMDLNGKNVAEDSSGNGYHSVGANGTWVQDGGVYGGALSFNGTSDLVQLNLGSTPAGSFLKDAFTEHSVSLWFKANDTQTQQVLFERGGNSSGLAIQLNANKLEAAVASADVREILSADFTDTASWHHLMVTFNNGAFTMYLDGKAAATANAKFTKVNTALNEAAIGAKFSVYAFGGDNKTGAWFNGMIDNVRLYSTAVTPSIEVSGVSLDKARATMTVGESVYLAASLQPLIATNRNVTWTSSDESVVTVAVYGSTQALIEAKKAGSATVIVTTEDGHFTAASEITVLPALITMPLEGLEAWYKLDAPYSNNGKLVAEDSTGNGHHSVNAIGNWLPDGGVDGGAFSFNGSTSIIQLNTTNVTFLKDEFSAFTAAMWFKPNDLNTRQVLFERGGSGAGLAIQLNGGKLEAAVVSSNNRFILSKGLTDPGTWHHVAASFGNGTFKLYLDGQLAGETATSYTKVASAANEGAVGARFAVDAFNGSGGGAYFNGVIDDVRLYNAAVEPFVGAVHAESVVLDRAAVTLGKGLTQELAATVFPQHATNQNVVWASSDESVAKVMPSPSEGLKAVVQGVSEGTASITVTTVDGGYSATSIVTVEQIPVEGVSLVPADLELVVGTTQALTPAFTPANATNRNISWSSDSPSVAAIDESGVVTALQPGTATITVTTEDGGHTATMVVTVKGIPVAGISLNHTKVALAVDQSHLLSAKIVPNNATNLNVIWSSSDPSVATVDASGRVTAEAAGSALITARTEDGGYEANSEVTVNTYALQEVDNLFRVDSGPDIGKKATLYDGTIEKYNGYYYAMGTGTNGYLYRSKDMIHWESPYQMIWSPSGTTPVDPSYFEYGASDLFFHNGTMFYAFNGTSLIHGDPSTMNTTPDFRHDFWDKRFDLGIDPQLFVAHNGDLIFLRKVNPDEVDPNTGAPKPGRAGAWLWNVQSFFNEMGNPARGKALETVTTQTGHWANMNFVNFEGPELYYHNGQYYMLFVGNQMFPETGLYETGVAQADSYDEITNASKYPGKLLARNIEQLILKYRVILPTAEHGGQSYQYTFHAPEEGWNTVGSDVYGWVSGEGGFGWPEENREKIPSIYNDGKTAASEIWGNPNGPGTMWAKRSFQLDAVPETTSLRYRLEGYGKLYLNGVELFEFGGRQRAYKMVEVPSELLKAGENVIAVEISTNGDSALPFYHLDFGLYDTNGHPVEPDIVGPSQPNVIKGPNGFETWVTYKAFWNSDNGQGKDRVYFWDQEMVVDGPTSFDSEGLHPDAWTPTFQDRFDSESSLQHYEIPEADVSIDDGALYFNAPGDSKRVLLNGHAAENFFMEANLRFNDKDFGDEGQAGIVVWSRDDNNYVNLLIDRDNRKLVIQSRIEGVAESTATDLPSTFAFLYDDTRTADIAEQYHTLKVYKNGSKLFAELDHYTLNDDRPVFEHEAMASSGQIGLISNKAKVRMDNVAVTTGWSEYGTYINGWDDAWSVSEKGLRSPEAGEALTVKGDRMLEHEFSVNVNTGALPDTGKAGVILEYIDDQNYVTASTNYATKEFELRKVVNGQEEIMAVASTARDTIYGHSNYDADGQREYAYDLRGEAEISSAKMLWFHGPFDYVNKFFELPQSDSADFKFDSWTDGWNAVPFTYQDKGRGDYHIADFTDHVKTKQLRLSVPSELNRPFTFALREEISAQNFYKVVRSKGKIYVWVNNNLIFDAEDPFVNKPAQAGLYTNGIQATYNAFTSFDVSGQLTAGDASLTVKSELAGLAGSNGWYVTDVLVTLRPEGEGSDHAGVFYSLDAGDTWQEYSSPIAVSAEGRSVIRYYAEDGAGNRTETATLTLRVDKTAPVLTLNGPSDVAVALGGTYSEQGATATDNIGPVDEIQITGEVFTNMAGIYTLRYKVSDQAGNIAAEAVRKVTVERDSSDNSYSNPLIVSDSWRWNNGNFYGEGDPYILKFNGVYYLYTSTVDDKPGVKVWSSEDLVHWQYRGLCAVEDVTKGAYAPEVVYWNGDFYMYTALLKDDGTTQRGHRVLKSSSPTGPFIAQTGNKVNGIDGHVFIDDDGQWYFYSTGNGNIDVRPMSDPYTFGGNLNTGAVMRGWTEGPTVFKRNGKYYMTYTGNHVWNDAYRIDYATSLSPLTGFVPAAAQNPILLDSEGEHVGLGHNSVIRGPDLDSDYIVYHSHANPGRNLNLDRIVWNGDEMHVLGPTTSDQPDPAMPDFSDRFQQDDLGGDWEAVGGGHWAIRDGNALVQDTLGGPGQSQMLLTRQETEDSFTAEFNLKQVEQGGSASPLIGAVFSYTDENNYGMAVLNRNLNQLETVFRIDGKDSELVISPLPNGYDYTKWHQIRVEKEGADYRIYVDGMLKQTRAVEQLGQGRIGYTTTDAYAEFGFVAFSNKVRGNSSKTAYKPIPGEIQAVHFNGGDADMVQIAENPNGGYHVAAFDTGTLQYNVNAAEAGTYDVVVRYAAASDSQMKLELDESTGLTGNIKLPATGGADSWSNLVIKDVNLPQGLHKLTVTAVSGPFNLVTLKFKRSTATVPVSDDFNDGDDLGWRKFESGWRVSTGEAPPFDQYKPVPGIIEAPFYNTGGEGIAYHDNTPENIGGAYRGDSVDVRTNTNFNGLNVGWNQADEWLKYNIDVERAGMYMVEVTTATTFSDNQARLLLEDGTDLTGPIQIPSSGAWNTWQTTVSQSFYLPEGEHTITFETLKGEYDFARLKFVSYDVPKSIPGIIEAVHYNEGGEGVGYHDNTASNIGGQYRNDQVDIGVNPQGGWKVGWNQTGEWLKYNVHVAEAAVYDASVRIATAQSSGKIRLWLDDETDLTGVVDIPNTGGFNNWRNVKLGDLTLPEGDHTIKVEIVQGEYDFASLMFYQTQQSWPLPGAVHAVDYMNGGEGIGYHDNTADNIRGLFRTDDVDIRLLPEGFTTGWNQTGEWLKYKVLVTEAGTYKLDLRVATSNVGAQARLWLDDGTDLTGIIDIPNTGGFHEWMTITKEGIALPAGDHTIKVEIVKGEFDFYSFRFHNDPVVLKEGVYKSPLSGYPKSVIGDSSWSDYTVEADIKLGSNTLDGGNSGILVRVNNPADGTEYNQNRNDFLQGYLAYLTADGVHLGKFNYNYQYLTGMELAETADQWQHMKVVADGARIRVYVGDTDHPVIDYTDHSDTAFTHGSVGVRSFNSESFIDNFTVVPNLIPASGSARITGPANVLADQTFTLTYGMVNVTTSVYAKDLTVHYDPSLLRYMDVESIVDGYIVAGVSEASGAVRILLADTGASPIIGTVDVLKLNFKAFAPAQTVTGSVYLSNVLVADAEGVERVLHAGSGHQVQITFVPVDKTALQLKVQEAQAKSASAIVGIRWGQYPQSAFETLKEAIAAANAVVGHAAATQAEADQAVVDLEAAIQTFESSVNLQATIGDLAVMAAKYDTDSSSPEWASLSMYDFDRSGTLDLMDLATMASKILDK